MAALDLLRRTVDRPDLEGIEVLDVGCGTKLSKALLDNREPIGRYVGVDVSPTVIAWLSANVEDERFEYHHLDARNDLYNPSGTPLDQLEQLPVGGRRFDLISLFSVFTHLDPADYVVMLRLLRHHVNGDGRLLFSLFVKDPQRPSPYDLAFKAMVASSDPAVAEKANDALARVMARPNRRFVDEVPGKPLLRARYDEDYALELIEGTGWEVMSLNPPERHIQHYMICRPV